MPQRPSISGFAWISGSEEAIGRTLSFSLAGYFMVTELQLKFPAGDTYQYDIGIFNDLDGTGEAYVTTTVRFCSASEQVSFFVATVRDVSLRLPKIGVPPRLCREILP